MIRLVSQEKVVHTPCHNDSGKLLPTAHLKEGDLPNLRTCNAYVPVIHGLPPQDASRRCLLILGAYNGDVIKGTKQVLLLVILEETWRGG